MFIQLYRTTDKATSEPIEFRYKPCDNTDGNRKRPRVSSPCYDSDSISGAVEQNAQDCSQSNYHDLEQLYADLPELKNVEFDTEGNFRDNTILLTLTINQPIFSTLFISFQFQ